jgi:cell division protein FtsB
MKEREISKEEEKKVAWTIQLFGMVKQLQREIEKKERNKRYFSIFVSGCITYFIIKILQNRFQSESDWIVFYGAFCSLCLHYIVDAATRTWSEVVGYKKFKKQLESLEKERIKLNIEVEDLSMSKEDQELNEK